MRVDETAGTPPVSAACKPIRGRGKTWREVVGNWVRGRARKVGEEAADSAVTSQHNSGAVWPNMDLLGSAFAKTQVKEAHCRWLQSPGRRE